MGKYIKGQEGYWLGKRKPISQETRDKISKTLMGHAVSESTKKLLIEKSPFKKGFIPWNKGKPWSEEMKKRISETNKRKGIEPIKKNEFPCGDKHPNWKGGITSENRKIRTSVVYKYWRKQSLIRDNFTCQKCKQSGGVLRVHHINNFSDFKELRLNENNGITFCKDCHKKFHKKYGNKNNTREQLIEFLK